MMQIKISLKLSFVFDWLAVTNSMKYLEKRKKIKHLLIRKELLVAPCFIHKRIILTNFLRFVILERMLSVS